MTPIANNTVTSSRQRRVRSLPIRTKAYAEVVPGPSMLAPAGVEQSMLVYPAAQDSLSIGKEGSMNRDEIEGKKENIKGRIKEAAGTLTGNKNLESEGADERADGAAQEEIGKARRKVGESIEELGKKIKR